MRISDWSSDVCSSDLLGEGVADLHGGTLLFRVFGEFGGCHGGAMDAVAAGLGADIDHRIAEAGGGRRENPVRLRQADGHRVDEDVAVVAVVEIHLAADGRHAAAVTVYADANHHTDEHTPGHET